MIDEDYSSTISEPISQMLFVLIIAAWIVLLMLVLGLGAAARAGDEAVFMQVSADDRAGQAEPYPWEPTPQLEISARANLGSPRHAPAGSSPLRSGGVAA
jgi:hypothetical protein